MEVMAAGVKRAELWITSKVWNDKHAPDDVIASCERSLAICGSLSRFISGTLAISKFSSARLRCHRAQQGFKTLILELHENLGGDGRTCQARLGSVTLALPI